LHIENILNLRYSISISLYRGFMAKSKEKLKAQQLRKEGNSIKDIAKKLEVSKSSVSNWCRDIRLSPKQIEKLHEKMVRGSYQGRMAGAQANKDRRLQKIRYYEDEARLLFDNLTNRELLLIGVSLYWAEGYKFKANIKFSNSDPEMIAFMMEWFREILNIEDSRFRFCIIINSLHKNRVDDVVNFWANLVKCPKGQFWKTCFVKTRHKKLYGNPEKHYGTLHIYIKSGVEEKYKIMGIIKRLGDYNMAG